jgi:hypothetical protein
VPKKIEWDEIKKAYLEEAETYASLALRFGVGKSTIEARASAEGWAALKKGKDSGVSRSAFQGTPQKPQIRARSLTVQSIDEIEIIQDAITKLSGDLHVAEPKSAEGVAGAIAKLVELHNRLVPKTASDLADMAIELGIAPADFIRALNSKWQERA